MHIARELMIKQLVKSPIAVLRPTLIYGAGDPHNSYGPNRLRRMAQGGTHHPAVEIKGSPRQNPITHRAFDVTALHRSFPTFVFTPLKDGLAKAQAVEQSGQF